MNDAMKLWNGDWERRYGTVEWSLGMTLRNDGMEIGNDATE